MLILHPKPKGKLIVIHAVGAALAFIFPVYKPVFQGGFPTCIDTAATH